MKFTVEVEEFWIEEEELSAELKSHVRSEVMREISASIKDKVEKQITEKINEMMDQKTSLVIESSITDFLATGTIVDRGKNVPITDHLRELFHNNTGWRSPQEALAKLAKRFGEEIKLQYNAAFANKIVMNMKEQGLLKDEVVQILLEGK